MADFLDENIFIVTNQDQKNSDFGYAVIYKIINKEKILNIKVGPSIANIFMNFDIIAAKAIYQDTQNSMIYVGVLDRTNKGLSAFLLVSNSTNFYIPTYKC